MVSAESVPGVGQVGDMGKVAKAQGSVGKPMAMQMRDPSNQLLENEARRGLR